MIALAAACVLLVATFSAVADDPCPELAISPAVMERLELALVTSAHMTVQLSALITKAIPSGFEVVARYRVEIDGRRFWIIAYDNVCCVETMADIHHRAAVIEEALGRKPQLFVVADLDGSIADAVVPVAAYRSGQDLLVASVYFAKGRCLRGVIAKAGDHYTVVGSHFP